MATALQEEIKKSTDQNKPKGLLSLNIDLINDDDDDEQLSYCLDETAYRQEGVSIGYDYLRLEGVTVTRGELVPSKLQIGQVIGRGAFSTVRRAQWRRRNQDNTTTVVDVAVKECSLLESSPQRRQMLLRELRALCRLTSASPTLVQLHGAFLQPDDDTDGFRSQQAVTMVLEYMDKGSLELLVLSHKKKKYGAAAAGGGGFPEHITAAITYQMLCGLAFLHAPERRLLHRDLKPANVLLNASGCVKLCDFGMATLLREEDSSLDACMTVLGTTKYLAPERLRARPYGRPSDVWSLGLIVWGCATGEATPWCDGVTSMVDLLVAIEEVSIVDALTRRNNGQKEGDDSGVMSKGLQEILVGCLHLEPTKRIPAGVLLQSPWFSAQQQPIENQVDAAECMRHFFCMMDDA